MFWPRIPFLVTNFLMPQTQISSGVMPWSLVKIPSGFLQMLTLIGKWQLIHNYQTHHILPLSDETHLQPKESLSIMILDPLYVWGSAEPSPTACILLFYCVRDVFACLQYWRKTDDCWVSFPGRQILMQPKARILHNQLLHSMPSGNATTQFSKDAYAHA